MTNSPHTTEFIEEIQQKLKEEKQLLEKDLQRIAHKDHGDYQANYPEYGRNNDENASEMSDYASLNATTEAIEARLEEVIAAIQRIENGTYGVTEAGEVIPEDRLRANPAATTIVTSDKN